MKLQLPIRVILLSALLQTIFTHAAFADGIPSVASPVVNKLFSGRMSWYGEQFHGKKTASGKLFDMNKLTCAHRTLPFGTLIQVTNPHNGKSIVVEVIDRGPYSGGRVMDVSREAARQLGTLLGGVAFVTCLVVTPGVTSSPESTTINKVDQK